MSVILVTGCSTGIGQETALHLARKGHDVYAAVRTPGSAEELQGKIAEENLSVTIVALDLTRPETIKSAVAEVVDHGEVVGDEDVGEMELRLQILEQGQNARVRFCSGTQHLAVEFQQPQSLALKLRGVEGNAE